MKHRILAGILTFAVCLSLFPTTALAAETPEEAELRATLRGLADDETYPNGRFEFLTPRMETSEDVKKAEFAIVRMGNTDEAASVTFKAIDMTARYGEDYTLEVPGVFFDKELPQNADAQPLSEVGVYEIEADTVVMADEAEETPASEPAAEAVQPGTDLRSARTALTGVQSDPTTWREADGAQTAMLSEVYGEMYDELPGVEYVLNFAPGEYTKTLKFVTIDDDISEDDEQVLFVLSHPVNCAVSENPTGFMNIKDNEEPEDITFGIVEDCITVAEDSFKAVVTVERTTGLHRYGTVVVSSAEGTAAEGEYYDGFVTELAFVPGQQYQKIEVPIKSHPGVGDVSFRVCIDDFGESAEVIVKGTLPTGETGADGEAQLMSAGIQPLADSSVDLWSRKARIQLNAFSWSGLDQELSNSGYGYYFVLPIESYNQRNWVTCYTDLSMVGRITCYSSDTSFGTQYKGGYYYDRENIISTESGDKIRRYGRYENYDTFNINDTDRASGKITFTGHVWGKCRNACPRFFKTITVYYLPIEVQIVPDRDDTVIQPKIWTSPTTYTNDKEKDAFWSGTLKFKGEDTSVTSKFFYNNDTVSFEPTDMAYPDETYLWGIKFEVKSGATRKFYYYKGDSFSIKDLYTGKLKDVNGETIGSIAKLTDKVNGEDFTCYRVYPVFRQKTAYTTIMIDTEKSSFAGNTWQNGQTVKTGMLDKLQINVAGDKGWAVSGFNLAQGNRYAYSVTPTWLERDLDGERLSNAQSVHDTWSPYAPKGKGSASDWARSVVNAGVATPGSYLFSPTKTDNSLQALYQKPEITVAVNPRANSADTQTKGAVAYLDKSVSDDDDAPKEGLEEGRTAQYTHTDANGLLRGDEIKVAPYTVGNAYQFVGGFNDPNDETKYKFLWQDFTGDIDKNGELWPEEIKALGNAYDLINKGVYAGNTFTYTPSILSSPILYFHIVPTAEKDTEFQNSLSGQVLLKSCSVIERGQSAPNYTTTPISNAQITAGGYTTTTDAKGQWKVKASEFDTGETYISTLSYSGRSYTGDVTVGRAATYIVDAYNTFDVNSFQAYRVSGSTLSALENTAISNEDKRHLYTFKIDELLPTTAVVKNVEVERYSSDGILKKTYTAVLNGASGRYEIKDPALLEQYKDNPSAYNWSFNPATEDVSPGDYLTVRVFDQNDVGYIKHDIGFTYRPELSVINIVNSFKSPVNNVIEFIGEVDMAFDLGLTAKMDTLDSKLSDLVEKKLDVAYTDDQTTISFGWNKEFKKSYDSSKKKDDKKDPSADPTAEPTADPTAEPTASPTESPAPQTAAERIKEEAKKLEEVSDTDSGNTEQDNKVKNEAADTAKDAVDKDSKDNKKTSKVTSDLKVDISVALELVMGLDTETNRYYFKDFVVTGVVTGTGGAKYEYTTPIGIVIFVEGTLSGDITAVLGIEPYYQNPANPNYLYTDEAGTIDLTKIGNADVNRQLTIYGKLMIRPQVSIGVGGKLLSDKIASVTLRGIADFDMVFTTAGDGAGNVTLSAKLELKILGGLISKNWDIARKKYDMFSINGGSLARLMSVDEDYRYDVITPEDTDPKLYLANRGGWNENAGIALLATGTDRYNETKLLQGVYPYAYPQIFTISEGTDPYTGADSVQLLLFLDSDGSGIFLKYSLYENGNWTMPQRVDNDATNDDTPQVEDLGDKLLITWSSEGDTSSDDPVVRLNSRDIKATFLDKATHTLSEPQFVTKTTQADVTADDYASASYYVGADGKKQLLVTYIKTQYEQTGDDLTVGDLLEAYSTVAYRFYDFATGEWVDTYSDQETQSLMRTMSAEDAAAFAENWYGQGFVDLSRYVTVDESGLGVDEDDPAMFGYEGLWEKVPNQNDISISTLTSDPKVVEHETINCSEYSVSAFLIDLDGSNSTIDDRDIFLQLYSFAEGKFYPAMRLTNDAHNQSYLELADTPDGVKLYYISNGNIVQQNISRLVENLLKMQTADGTDVLVINKQYQVHPGEEIILTAPEDSPYTEFIVNSDGNNVYLTWTENSISFKDGVDRNSDAATQPENYFVERHMYMAMETYEEFEVSDPGDNSVETFYASKWTKPVQMTDEQGANYSDIDCVMVGNGILRCVYLKGESKITDISGTKMPAEDVNDRALVSADFDFNVERYSVSIDNVPDITAGREAMPIQVTVKNESLLTMSDVHLALSMVKDGETFLIDDVTLDEIGGGESVTTMITWDVPDTLEGVSLVAAVDQGGLDYGSVTETLQSDSLIEIADVSYQMLDRNTAQFTVLVVNSGSENAKAEQVYLNCDDVEFASEEFDLVSGGMTVVTLTAQMPENAFVETRTETTIMESAPVKLYTTGSIVDHAVARTADIALEALVDGFGGITDRDGNTYSDSIQLSVGDLLLLMGQGVDKVNAPRVAISSDDTAVVSVINGVLTGEKPGTAKLKVELYPNVDTYITGDSDLMQPTDIYNTLPSCLIKTKELTVQVSDGGSGSSSGGASSVSNKPSVSVGGDGEGGKVVAGSNGTVTITPNEGYEIVKITVNGKEVAVPEDGKLTGLKQTDKVVVTFGKITVPASQRFIDVVAGAWYEDAVQYVVDHGLFNGTSDTTFAPEGTMTRGMLATVLYRLAQEPEITAEELFRDVASGQYYTQGIAWAAEKGIVTGYGNGDFGPDDPITREQLSAMLYRYEQTQGGGFKGQWMFLLDFQDRDQVSEWAYESMCWMTMHGIVNGKGDKILDPKGNATRAEVAAMLMRYCEIVRN